MKTCPNVSRYADKATSTVQPYPLAKADKEVNKMVDDTDLVNCVGRDIVIKICNQQGCSRIGGLLPTCVPHNGRIDLCEECYAEIEERFPECITEEE